MRTFHIGGVASKDVETSELFAKRAGQVRFTRIRSVINAEGRQVVLGRNGEISIVDDRGREVEKQRVPNGAVLSVTENQQVKPNDVLCTWDPHSIPIIAQVGGRVRLEDLVEGQSMRTEREQSGTMRRTMGMAKFSTSITSRKARVWTPKKVAIFPPARWSRRRLANQRVLRTSLEVCRE
jgi:DNA-directed RNA polymerase subunit beta'